MKIFLIGASGMIGSRVLAEALGRGHNVIAGSRNPGKIAAGAGVTPVVVDATDAASMTAHAATADVMVVASAARSTGDPVTESHAIGTAVIAAARAAGKRLVMVGGAGSLNLPDGSPLLPHLPDMYRAEATGMRDIRDMLVASGLDWTFFAPAAMIEPGVRTGVFRVGTDTLMSDSAGDSRISAEDYAVALVDELESPAHRNGMMTIAY